MAPLSIARDPRRVSQRLQHLGRPPRRPGTRETSGRFAHRFRAVRTLRQCATLPPPNVVRSSPRREPCSAAPSFLEWPRHCATDADRLAVGKGTRIDGLPAAASSLTVPMPARLTTISACANAAGISARNAEISPSIPDARKPGASCRKRRRRSDESAAQRSCPPQSGQLSCAARFSVREPWLPPVIKHRQLVCREVGRDRERTLRAPATRSLRRRPAGNHLAVSGNSPERAIQIAPACDA